MLMPNIISSIKIFILSSNLPPLSLCCPGAVASLPPSLLPMPLVQTEQNIPLSPAKWWRRHNHFSHCYGCRKLLWWSMCKIPVRKWFYTIIRNVQVLDRSWQFNTLFILSTSPSSCIHGIILWHLIFSLPFNLLPEFLCRCSKNL